MENVLDSHCRSEQQEALLNNSRSGTRRNRTAIALFSALMLWFSPGFATGSAEPSRRGLDAILQESAFGAFVRPRTGRVYAAQPPANLAGIRVQVIRLRSGSFYSRGITFNEITVPRGIIEQPYVQRLALVYQNLGNWSSVYYHRPGFRLVSPVLGMLAYDAYNLSAKNPTELQMVATEKPIRVAFPRVSKGLKPVCVAFFLNGSVEVSNVSSDYSCTSYYQGHFALLAESEALAPSPSPARGTYPSPLSAPTASPKHKKSSSKWKIALGSVLGCAFLVVLAAALVIGIAKYRQKARIAKMERRADEEEALHTTSVGTVRAPAAGGTRTQPFLENEYTA